MELCTKCGERPQTKSGHRKQCYRCSRGHPIGEKQKEFLRKTRLGPKNPFWKGDDVTYGALHDYVEWHMPRPKHCGNCGKRKPLDLANKGVYNRNLTNWEYLCRRCHMEKDGRLATLIQRNKNR